MEITDEMLDKDAKERKLKKIKHLFDKRITIAKEGREAFTRKDYVVAAQKYHEYLNIYAEYNGVDTIFKLTPQMFDKKTQVSEMFLVSQIYWDLSRINEMTPKLTENYRKSLYQFVKFTINQPYQVLNAEMLRKYLKKTKNSNHPGREDLSKAYQDIYVQSNKCFIATYLFSENDPVVNTLRVFKRDISKSTLGTRFIVFYYKYSEKIISMVETSTISKFFFKKIIRPALSSFAYIYRWKDKNN